MLGDKLKMLQEAKGLSKIDLGKALNLTDRAIAYYESDDRRPNYEVLIISSPIISMYQQTTFSAVVTTQALFTPKLLTWPRIKI